MGGSPTHYTLLHTWCSASLCTLIVIWGAEGAPILFSEIGFCMASCSYIYIYVCMYIYICQDGGAVGFVEFTKLLFALSSLAQPLK